MDLPRWLQKVAAAANHELKPLTAEVYLEELVTWPLSDEEWETIRKRAKLRLAYFPGRLPGLPELRELAEEIWRDKRARQWEEDQRKAQADAVKCPEEFKPKLRKFGVVK